MGSTSDLPVMEKAMTFLNDMKIPFEVNALSAHRTPEAVEHFAKEAAGRGVKVIIAGAGMAAALPGVIAAQTILPVIGVPIKGMLDSHSRCQWCHERCGAGHGNVGAGRCRHCTTTGYLQRRSEAEDRKSQQGLGGSEI